jgi:hypothetical protein
MSRIEKRLWLIWSVVFALALAASVTTASLQGQAPGDFPSAQLTHLRRALRPRREAGKFERAASVDGIQVISLQTTATRIRVIRNEAMNDLSVTLEGRFLKTNLEPLQLEKTPSAIRVRVDEGLTHLPWRAAFDGESHNSELTVVVPRRYAGKLVIKTVSGQTDLEGLSLGELRWASVSGSLESRDGEIHVARLESVSGDIDFSGESLEFYLNLTSGGARVVLKGLEHIISPKIDAQTVSGTISMAIPSSSSVRISMSSFTGRATSTIDLKKSMQSSGALEGQLGLGGGELRLRSVSGVVRLSTF